ncbi:MAG: hypothetical protein IJU70_08005 [Lentisphaeria bacterium]|nr:hypothetical protein [Lentisphaeria bacterium]
MAASVIPVISAVGHERDFTICDFAADLRAPTPSAAAELVISHHEELFNRMRRAEQGLRQSVSLVSARCRSRVEQALASLNRHAPGRTLQLRAQRIDELEMRLLHAVRTAAADRRAKLERLSASLLARDPAKLLERGYALVFDPATGLPVTTSHVPPETRLDLRFADGRLPVRTLKE